MSLARSGELRRLLTDLIGPVPSVRVDGGDWRLRSMTLGRGDRDKVIADRDVLFASLARRTDLSASLPWAELDGYPPRPLGVERSVVPGELPPGFGLASFSVGDFDRALAAAAPTRAADASSGATLRQSPRRHTPRRRRRARRAHRRLG